MGTIRHVESELTAKYTKAAKKLQAEQGEEVCYFPIVLFPHLVAKYIELFLRTRVCQQGDSTTIQTSERGILRWLCVRGRVAARRNLWERFAVDESG